MLIHADGTSIDSFFPSLLTVMDQSSQNIIVVDDNDAVRNSLRLLLQFSGYTTTVFSSAESCLSTGDLSTADCFVIDLKLPKMNGVEMAQRIRSMGYSVPIIFMSGNIDSDLYSGVQAIRNSTCVGKPCEPKDLLETIENCIAAK